MKTPEQYFVEKDFLPSGKEGEELSYAEKAFLQKYMGWSDEGEKGELPSPAKISAAPGFEARSDEGLADVPEGGADEPDIISQLKEEYDIQLVGFYVGEQEFTVPIQVVQEVIKYVPPTQLPAAPFFMAGIVNLRGRVTPLVRLSDLLGASEQSDESGFIVVCRCKGLQLGLLIDKVKTMYRVPQEQLEWSIESHLGAGVDFVGGLMKAEGGKLVGIISVDKIVDRVLKG